jgi:hypothetical protein
VTVEEDHVYHVGKLNLLSHNQNCSPILPSSTPIPFNRRGETFYLIQGNNNSGWQHIFRRHIDTSQHFDATKFPVSWTVGDIILIMERTIRHGTPSKYYNLKTFTYHGAYKGSGYKTFKVTINTDGTIRTFHMME